MPREILIAVSACLVGERVRYDGGHKRHAFVADTLSRIARLIPVCPEMDIGLGAPREPIELVRKKGHLRLVGVRSGRDHTEVMTAYAARRVEALAATGICGFVLKSGSPSCGLEGVPIMASQLELGRGLFAAELVSRLPLLPVEEEAHLADEGASARFIAEVLAYHRHLT